MMPARRGSRRVRPIQQMEATECGVACLGMILDYYGCSKPLEALREACGTSRDGNSAADLLKSARRLGLAARGVRVAPETLGSLRLPAVLHWELNHFVVLERCHAAGATLVDPATGRVRVDAETLDRSLSGIALEFEPTPQLERQVRRPPSVGKYFSALSASRSRLAFVMIAGAATQLLGIVAPAASQLLIDEVIRPLRREWLLPVLAVMALSAFGEVWLRSLHALAMTSLQGVLGFALSERLGLHLLRLPLSFVESRSRGDLLDRANSQAALGQLLSHIAMGLFDLVFALVLAALMLAYDIRLAALALSVDVLHVLLLRLLTAQCREQAAGEVAARAREHAVVLEAAASADLVKAFGLEHSVRAWYSRRLAERLRWTIRSQRRSAGASRLLSVLDAAARALVLFAGGNCVIRGQMTLGVFAGFLAIRELLSGPLNSLVDTLEGWLTFESTLARADDLLEEQPVRVGTRSAANLTGTIELVGVSFRYGSGGPWLLRDVSFTIQAGEHAVLIGPSGQGKSTLLRIISGLLEPTSGQVLYDGVNVRAFSPESLGKRVGTLVGQPLILADSVLNNLSLRSPAASEEAIRRACGASCFEEVVRRLPRGYASLLPAEGASLSGGERQRLGLAQALLEEPTILFLDEATCFLDADTESRILSNIARSRATVVSVAHRPAVIQAAHRVLHVSEARVSEGVRADARPAQGTRARTAQRTRAHLTLLSSTDH